MSNTNISLIIPVYNVEKYIRRCIESVLDQTYKSFELLLIDDGSSDSSGNVCDDLANKDNGIKVIHKSNGGSVPARNVGLNIERKQHFTFVDTEYLFENNKIDNLIIKCIKYPFLFQYIKWSYI